MEFADLIWLGVTGVGSIWGYFQSRRFVRNKLRFVDKAQRPVAPVVAGAAAALLAAPLVWVLPFVGGWTAALFGVGIGAGVRQGQKDVKRLPGM
jgi:hypothetical protein